MKRIAKDPEERKKELIDTAERLFITNGYDQTAVSDISRQLLLRTSTTSPSTSSLRLTQLRS